MWKNSNIDYVENLLQIPSKKTNLKLTCKLWKIKKGALVYFSPIFLFLFTFKCIACSMCDWQVGRIAEVHPLKIRISYHSFKRVSTEMHKDLFDIKRRKTSTFYYNSNLNTI